MAGRGLLEEGRLHFRMPCFPFMVGELHFLVGNIPGHGGKRLPPWWESQNRVVKLKMTVLSCKAERGAIDNIVANLETIGRFGQ